MRIARREHDRIGSGQRRCNQNGRIVDDPAYEIRDKRDVKPRRISDRGAFGHPEAKQVQCIDRVGSRESVDIVTLLVGPRSSVDSMDQKDRWAFATLGESDASVAPIEATLFSADQIGELVDALPGKRIIGCSDAKQGATG